MASTRLDDSLPIVKMETHLPLAPVLDSLPPDAYYHAQAFDASFSRWKAGPVGRTMQHVTVQYGVFASMEPSAETWRRCVEQFVQEQPDSLGHGLTVKQAVAWPPPPDARKRGEPDYRCVVLELEAAEDSTLLCLRAQIRRAWPCWDPWPTFRAHVTVAYVLEPETADELVRVLNARFRDEPVPVEAVTADDNGFPFFGRTCE
jgi:hypothetical protein